MKFVCPICKRVEELENDLIVYVCKCGNSFDLKEGVKKDV